MDRIEREKREDLAIEADRKRRKLEIELARKKEEHILHLHQIELKCGNAWSGKPAHWSSEKPAKGWRRRYESSWLEK